MWAWACRTSGLRLRVPEPVQPYDGHYDVHKFGPSCPQQRMVIPQGLNTQLEQDVSKIVQAFYEDVTTDGEDCEAPFYLVLSCREYFHNH